MDTYTILKFANDHPAMAFLLICVGFMLSWLAAALLEDFLNIFRSLVVRLYRVIMVALRGWPPAHLDADGDWKPEQKTDS